MKIKTMHQGVFRHPCRQSQVDEPDDGSARRQNRIADDVIDAGAEVDDNKQVGIGSERTPGMLPHKSGHRAGGVGVVQPCRDL